MTDLLIRAAGWALMFAPFILIGLLQRWTASLPESPPARPLVASADPEWILLPFQLIAGLAGLCWCLIGLVVFLSPLLLLVWVLL